MAASARVAPHRGVVDAREVGRQVDLLASARTVIGVAPRLASGGRVPVGRAGQAQQTAQRSDSYSRPERAAPLQLGHQAAGDLGRGRAGIAAGPEPAAGQARRLPVLASGRQAAPGVPVKVTASLRILGSRAVVQPGLAGHRGARVGVEEDQEVSRKPGTVSAARPARPGRRGSRRRGCGHGQRRAACTNARSVARPASRYAAMPCARAPTTGWPCGGRGRDRRALDAEPAALEVDVVQLVPIDEAAGRDIANLGVVLPAVPQPPHDLHVVGRLGEQVTDQLAGGRRHHCRRGWRQAGCDGRSERPRPGSPTPSPARRPALR